MVDKDALFIPDSKRLPLLIVLTDGYFYGKLHQTDLGIYEKSKNDILFVTKTDRNLFEGSSSIIFE